MAKKLRLFNGRIMLRPEDRKGLPDHIMQGHGYIAAYSKKDAASLLNEYSPGRRGNLHELNVYWSADCWGNAMEGIAPERGLWITTDRVKQEPRKVI